MVLYRAHAGDVNDEGIRYSHIIDQIWNELRAFVRYVVNTPDYTVPERLAPLAAVIVREYIPKLGQTKNEITSISQGLQGKYVEPGPGGALPAVKLMYCLRGVTSMASMNGHYPQRLLIS